MNTRITLIASLLAASTLPALAGPFDGLQASLGAQQSQARLQGGEVFDNTATDAGYATGEATRNRTGLQLGLAYGVSAGDWQTTFGLDYLGAGHELRANDGLGNTYGLDLKRRVDVYVAPGYALDRQSVVYAKLGYSHLSLDNAFNAATGALSGGPGTHAVMYGVGFKQKIGDNTSPLFYSVEYTTGATASGTLVDASGNTSDTRLKLSNFGVSLGYLFN